MTWKQLTERDCREWMLFAIDPRDRHMWRPGVRSAMAAARQLHVPERGPLMWILPWFLHVNQKSDDDDDQIVNISFYFSKKIRCDTSCELSAEQMIQGKCQAFFFTKK